MHGEVDLVVLHTSGQRRALPPSFGSVSGELGSVVLLADVRVAVVAQLTADHLSRRLIITSSRSCQTTEKFRPRNILAASCCCRYVSALCQVEIGRRQHLCICIHCQQQISQYLETEKPLHCQMCSGHRRKVLPTRHLCTRWINWSERGGILHTGAGRGSSLMVCPLVGAHFNWRRGGRMNHVPVNGLYLRLIDS